jgi:hypothetical protein
MIRLVDGNNWFRRRIEDPAGGSVLRNLVGEVERSPMVEVWCWDGYGARRRRVEKYPAYKSKRVKPGEDIYKSRTLLQSALLHTKAIQVRVADWEADDVIATLVGRFGTSQDIRVESNDKDLLQLETMPNVKIGRDPVKGVDASEIRLWKTLTGDSTDTITGIPDFGPKSWEKCNKDAFRNLFEDATLHVGHDADEIMRDFRITKRCAAWLLYHEPELRAMYDIIGLYTVPWDDVTANMIAGTPAPEKADALLKEFLQ